MLSVVGVRPTRFLSSLAVLTAALAAANCGSDDGGTKVVLGTACDAGTASQAPAPSCSTPRAVGTAADAGLADAGYSCTSDSDCTAGENGRCGHPASDAYGLYCSYDQCATNSDCGPKATCVCGTRDGTASGANACVASACGSDADCGAGFTCALSGNGDCGATAAPYGYYCHSANDDCLNDCDCASQGGGACRYDSAAAHWYCAPVVVCAG